jgi:hypothetical protein
LRDHFSNTLYGTALRSKAPPIEWLTKWLATKGAGPTVDSKCVHSDQVKTPYELCYCRKPDLSRLRTFDYRA